VILLDVDGVRNCCHESVEFAGYASIRLADMHTCSSIPKILGVLRLVEESRHICWRDAIRSTEIARLTIIQNGYQEKGLGRNIALLAKSLVNGLTNY
jgi:hypothetical protein